jgi:type II secretory ATPase GspE/PulE/Tfp pilus assembly ATPase PilB-like protein
MQAAQTGHLVLSTLHTRNAHGALARLKNLGIDNETIESCLLSVSSQRLVRKTCQSCHSTSSTTTKLCQKCKGAGELGRIGVHEVLNKSQIMDSSLTFLSMWNAGLEYVRRGLISQAGLEAEMGTPQ